MPEPPASPEPPMNEVPAPEPPAEDMPEEPAATAPADEPVPEELPPATKPSEDVEDLFKDNDTDKKDDDKKADADEAAPAAVKDQAAEGDAEDLFSEPDKQADKSASTEPDEEMKDDTEKLFEEPAEAEAPKEEAASVPATPQAEPALRLWTDNTGKWHVRARLVVVGENTVRLLKENGKYTTVSYDRLSSNDLAFVRGHAESAIAGNF